MTWWFLVVASVGNVHIKLMDTLKRGYNSNKLFQVQVDGAGPLCV